MRTIRQTATVSQTPRQALDLSNQGQTQQFLQRLCDRMLLPNAEIIARIMSKGILVGCAYSVHGQMARTLGLPEGGSGLFDVPEQMARNIAEADRRVGCSAGAAWILSERPGRILLISGELGTLRLNLSCEDGLGVTIEPGTTDAAWKS